MDNYPTIKCLAAYNTMTGGVRRDDGGTAADVRVAAGDYIYINRAASASSPRSDFSGIDSKGREVVGRGGATRKTYSWGGSSIPNNSTNMSTITRAISALTTRPPSADVRPGTVSAVSRGQVNAVAGEWGLGRDAQRKEVAAIVARGGGGIISYPFDEPCSI